MPGRTEITLVGDGIENPANAQTMADAAAMFGCRCLFRDRYGLAAEWQAEGPAGEPSWQESFITYGELARDYSPVVAFDNLDGAANVYGFHVPGRPRPAVVMGNER